MSSAWRGSTSRRRTGPRYGLPSHRKPAGAAKQREAADEEIVDCLAPAGGHFARHRTGPAAVRPPAAAGQRRPAATAPRPAAARLVQRPEVSAAAAIQTPKVDTSTLPNGMKLYLLEDHELPVVSGTALVRTGNLFDPQDKIGLASVTGIVMRIGGTQEKTGDQLDELLENMAASVESSIGETSAYRVFLRPEGKHR